MSTDETVDYVALLTAAPTVLVVGDESFEFSLALAHRAVYDAMLLVRRPPPFEPPVPRATIQAQHQSNPQL